MTHDRESNIKTGFKNEAQGEEEMRKEYEWGKGRR